MAISRISFGEWTPDQPGLTNGLRRAENVYPKLVGYGAIPIAVNYSASASENLNNVELNNKYINKGNLQENDSIALFNSVMFSNYSKNTERLNNEWLTGEADIVLDDQMDDSELLPFRYQNNLD